ncbi:unnamed protein product [Urochloa humidicola]
MRRHTVEPWGEQRGGGRSMPSSLLTVKVFMSNMEDELMTTGTATSLGELQVINEVHKKHIYKG